MSNHDPSWDYDYEDELAAAMAAEDAERQRDYEAAERLRRNR